jgi:hypothetical protein
VIWKKVTLPLTVTGEQVAELNITWIRNASAALLFKRPRKYLEMRRSPLWLKMKKAEIISNYQL